MNHLFTIRPEASDADMTDQLAGMLGALNSLLCDHLHEEKPDTASQWAALFMGEICEVLADGLAERAHARARASTKAAAPAAAGVEEGVHA